MKLLALPVILAAFLWAAGGVAAHAAPSVPAPAAVAFPEDEFEGEEEPDFEEECFELEEGLEECEEVEPGTEPSTGRAERDRCPLQAVRAQARVARGRLELVVRYDYVAPSRVYVELTLWSGRGPVRTGVARRRLARRGLLRVSERLSAPEARRARSSRGGDVALDLLEAPGRCQTLHVGLRRNPHRRGAWSSSGRADS